MTIFLQWHNLISQLDLWVRDTYDQLMGKGQPMLPPRRLMYDGPQDPATFVKNGEEFLAYYVDQCRLKPTESIIEIGSGMGRKAVPLTKYLAQEGSYLGFEINRLGVNWCQQEITPRHPRFQFKHIDVFNGRYNPKGTLKASEYTFPVADGSADFIVLASVFTHMFADDVAHYLAEISRMLNPVGGRCLISYFILNSEARAQIEAGKSTLQFPYQHSHHNGCHFERPNRPEDAVAYDQEALLDFYAQHGLEITDIYAGSWCGRADFLSYQDLVLAIRKPK